MLSWPIIAFLTFWLIKVPLSSAFSRNQHLLSFVMQTRPIIRSPHTFYVTFLSKTVSSYQVTLLTVVVLYITLAFRKFSEPEDNEIFLQKPSNLSDLAVFAHNEKNRSGFSEHCRSYTTLIMYVFAKTDSKSIDNLRYFVDNGIHDEYCFVLILQQAGQVSKFQDTNCIWPRPSFVAPHFLTSVLGLKNVLLVPHVNECYDLGTVGWYLACHSFWKNFSYFVILNSSVRGPFLPSPFPSSFWPKIFTLHINDTTKLVGATVNCEFWPHVQSYIFATDLIGIQSVLASDSLACHNTRDNAIRNGELMLSKVMLRNGYDIKAIIPEQLLINWRDWAAWVDFCELHPNNPTLSSSEYLYNLYDTIFVKVHDAAPGMSSYHDQNYAELLSSRQESKTG